MITLPMIDQAADAIRSAIRRTPLLRSEAFERAVKSKFPIYFKLENLQYTGSFKARGALNKILSVQEIAKKRGVITASAGNHAQGVAFHCQRLGINAKIVMPEATPLVKVNSTRQWGAEIVFFGDSYQESSAKAHEIQKAEDRVYIHAFDDEQIMAGQGTVAKEILEDAPDVQVMVIPIGGGGLIAGAGTYLKAKNAKAKVIGVQAEGSSNFLPSLKEGKPVTLDSVATIAEGIAVKRMGDQTFEVCRKIIDETILVNDEEISAGILWLLENERLFTEGCGGAAIAALLQRGQVVTGPTAVVVTGGNLDVNLLARIIERGLVKTGRLVLFDVLIPDAPGSLHRLLQVFAELKASVVQINHERVFQSVSLRDVYTTISLETQGPEHVQKIRQTLAQKGWQAHFHESMVK